MRITGSSAAPERREPGFDADPPGGECGLARLLLAGDGVEGAYTPLGFELVGGGADLLADRIAHVHEIHHGALNDCTEWGSALHITARVPGARATFSVLLERCREIHEAFATFAGVALANEFGADAAAALARYPLYAPPLAAFERLVGQVHGPNRRYLLATQYARVCMQAPVLARVVAVGQVRPAELRVLDTPNGRWRWLRRRGEPLARHAADAGDQAACAVPAGAAAIGADEPGGDPLLAMDLVNDAVWETWEHAAYQVLADALAGAGARPLAFDGHQEGTQMAVAWAQQQYPGLRLAAALTTGPAPDDRSLAAATTTPGRHVATARRWHAELAHLTTEALASEVASNSVIEGRPVLVISARPGARADALYDWPAAESQWLRALPSPLVAVRLVAGGEMQDDLVIAHAPLDQPGDAERLASAWAGRGPVITCLSASCLTDAGWQRRWLPVLRSAGDLVVLVDVELDRFVRRRLSTGVHAAGVEVADTAGTRHAAAMCASGDDTLWLAIADELGIKLLLNQLLATSGLAVTRTAEHLRGREATLRDVLTHLLATEPFFDYAGSQENP
jgi:hypothetical protein